MYRPKERAEQAISNGEAKDHRETVRKMRRKPTDPRSQYSTGQNTREQKWGYEEQSRKSRGKSRTRRPKKL